MFTSRRESCELLSSKGEDYQLSLSKIRSFSPSKIVIRQPSLFLPLSFPFSFLFFFLYFGFDLSIIKFLLTISIYFSFVFFQIYKILPVYDLFDTAIIIFFNFFPFFKLSLIYNLLENVGNLALDARSDRVESTEHCVRVLLGGVGPALRDGRFWVGETEVGHCCVIWIILILYFFKLNFGVLKNILSFKIIL